MTYANYRFMVVDDMKTMRKIVGRLLSELGATQVVEADDGAVAWEALEKNTTPNTLPQIIISDITMPLLSGIDFLAKCRAHPIFKNTVFILITAESKPEYMDKAKELDVDGYILKPPTPAAFKECLDKALAKRPIK